MHPKLRSVFPWLLVTVASMAGALSLWKLWPRADAPAGKQVIPVLATRSAGTAPRPAAPRRAGDERWRLGSRRTYALELSSQLENAGEGGGAWVAVTLRGNLHVAIAELEPAIVLRGDLADAALAMSSDTKTAASDALASIEKHLTRPFYATMHPSGGVELVHLDRDTDLQSELLIKTVLAHLQHVVEDQGEERPSWTTTERDTSGRFIAEYQQVETGSYRKRKLRYVELNSAIEGFYSEQSHALDSSALMEMGASALPLSVDAKDVVDVDLGESEFKSRTQVALRTVAASDLTRVARPVLDGLVSTRLDQPMDRQIAHREQPLAPGENVVTLLRDLDAAGDDVRLRAGVQDKLVALLRGRPSTAAELVGRIAQLAPEDVPFALGALSDAATPEAQNALLEISKDGAAAAELRQQALANLSLAEGVSEEAVRGVQELAADPKLRGDLRMSAVLAVGSTVKSASASGATETTAAAVADLAARYDSAPAESDQTLYLAALGNSGSAGALETIEKALRSPSASVRASAVQALRLIPGAEAESLLISALSGDPEEGVRGAALNAASYRELTPALQDALARCLKTDASEYVRLDVVALLDQRSRRFTGALALLQWAAASDPSSEVRTEAKKSYERLLQLAQR